MAPSSTPANTVEGKIYIHTLASFVRQHESKLADFVRKGPPAMAPSWTTILTMGVISADVPVARKPPLILRFDPHHLYYLLLKFDEVGVPNIGSLDVQIDGGPSRPMSVNYGPDVVVPSGTGGMFGGGKDADTQSLRSTFSAVSTFSLGSGWWGSSAPAPDESADVKYLYSSCTKLPALRLGPFTFSSALTSAASAVPTLSKPVKDFQDCPPPNVAVPLYAFKNLQSLMLEDLDPRGFMGWDTLSMQLRSLDVKRSGMEDIGELLCDAVVEDAERRKKGRGGVGEERRRRQNASQESEAPAEEPTTPTSPSAYPVPPPAAWNRLGHLSLSSNSLTFIPSPPLSHLPSLTSLDLSNNLLISIPPGLAHLHSLRSLNLSDNMIESLLGISKALGNVAVINLSKNRIDNLSGLDRLFALERLDLRENRIRESLEVSRLATLPCLQEVWIEQNPFSKSALEGGEENYRVKCFTYFAKEGHGSVLLDGTAPGMNERRAIDSQQTHKSSGRRASASGLTRSEEARTAGEAKVVGRRVVTTPFGSRIKPSNGHDLTPQASTSDLPSTSPSGTASSPPATPSHAAHKARRRPRRIVDLDGTIASGPTSTTAGSSRGGVESGNELTSDSDLTSSPALAAIKGSGKSLVMTEGDATTPKKSRHARYPTSPVGGGGEWEGTPQAIREGSTSLGPSAKRAAARRERVSASTFEPPSPGGHDDTFTSKGGSPNANSGEAFRKRIEALRNEVGESWLSVLSEREAAAERSKSQSEESGTDGGKKATAGPVASTSAAGQEDAEVAVSKDGATDGAVDGQPVVKVVGKKKKKGKKKGK